MTLAVALALAFPKRNETAAATSRFEAHGTGRDQASTQPVFSVPFGGSSPFVIATVVFWRQPTAKQCSTVGESLGSTAVGLVEKGFTRQKK